MKKERVDVNVVCMLSKKRISVGVYWMVDVYWDVSVDSKSRKSVRILRVVFDFEKDFEGVNAFWEGVKTLSLSGEIHRYTHKGKVSECGWHGNRDDMTSSFDLRKKVNDCRNFYTLKKSRCVWWWEICEILKNKM